MDLKNRDILRNKLLGNEAFYVAFQISPLFLILFNIGNEIITRYNPFKHRHKKPDEGENPLIRLEANRLGFHKSYYTNFYQSRIETLTFY